MPDLEVRLEMLTAAARYDASCAFIFFIFQPYPPMLCA
jgi:hypothetical protein